MKKYVIIIALLVVLSVGFVVFKWYISRSVAYSQEPISTLISKTSDLRLESIGFDHENTSLYWHWVYVYPNRNTLNVTTYTKFYGLGRTINSNELLRELQSR